MRLIALRPLRYAGKRVEPGAEFDAKDAHAKLLMAVKKAKALRRETVELPPPPPEVVAVIGPSVAALSVEDERDRLRADAEALKIDVDGRWGIARLHEEIAAAREQRVSATADVNAADVGADEADG